MSQAEANPGTSHCQFGADGTNTYLDAAIAASNTAGLLITFYMALLPCLFASIALRHPALWHAALRDRRQGSASADVQHSATVA